VSNPWHRDVRVAWRGLRRTPVLTAVAVLSIALGIAATTAVFSVVDAALFRPPPLSEANRLAILLATSQESGGPVSTQRWSWPRSRFVRQRARSFERVASFSASVLALTDGTPEPVTAEIVSSEYLPLLRVHLVEGRGFAQGEDEAAGGFPVVVLGYDLWRRRFGGDRSIVGRTVGVNGVLLRVIGIVSREFAGLSGRAQLWIPASMAPRLSYADYLVTNQDFISVVGRLRDGVSLEQARAELAVLGEEAYRLSPSSSQNRATKHYAATALSLNDARIDPTTRRPMFLLLGAVACLLILSCANVAGLLLGRAASRRREIAIRVATGAPRARIIAQLLVEAALLATIGGVLGILIAAPLTSQLAFPPAMARGRNFYGAIGEFATPGVDLRVLVCCVALCAATTLSCGLLPAFRASRVDLTVDLKEGARAARSGRGRTDARQWIVAVETALAVALLFGGGSLIASWRRMELTNLGFERSHLLTFVIRPSEVQYPAPKAPAFIERVLSEVARVPGVQAATVDGCTPIATGCANSTLYIMGRVQPRPAEAPGVLRHYVGPDHFRVLGVPVLRGRAFTPADRAGSAHVAVINQTAARRFWPHQDPIGQHVWFGGGSTFDRPDSSAEIVGVVADVAYQQLDNDPFQPDFYTPYTQFTYATRFVLVRTSGEPTTLVPELRDAVRRVDPNLALFDVQTMGERMHGSWNRLSYQIRLLATFAIVALVLAGSGIFAVITQSVGDRRREIGVRVALGATPAQIIFLIGDRGARPAMVGLGVGLIVSLAIGRAMESLVFGARTLDMPVSGAVIGLTVLVVAGATYFAARRALFIQPVDALKSD
jgi:putative ABC transport system permease protein